MKSIDKERDNVLWDRYRQAILDKNYNEDKAKRMGFACFTVVAQKHCGTMQECFELLISFVEESKTEQEYIDKAMKAFFDKGE